VPTREVNERRRPSRGKASQKKVIAQAQAENTNKVFSHNKINNKEITLEFM
jgi:hypothetical protein